MIVILGPTATGKTAIATRLAAKVNGEIISADSRQVFRGMDIGTGKDLSEYVVDGAPIPHHLIDIVEPGTEYSLYNFQHDCYKAYDQIVARGNTPILCGGTGLYLESVIRAYPLVEVPVNEELRNQLEQLSLEQLSEMLAKFKKLHNHTDTENRERVYRALEIETFYRDYPQKVENSRKIIEPMTVFGVRFDREVIRQRITQRLEERLDNGLIEEVQRLIDGGVSHERLQKYGLEYKFVSLYLQHKINSQKLFEELNIAIHQFAKRQSTWFRRMEKNGIPIFWIDGNLPMEDKIQYIVKMSKINSADN
jgi:tRNA dimethylallyltransferase